MRQIINTAEEGRKRKNSEKYRGRRRKKEKED